MRAYEKVRQTTMTTSCGAVFAQYAKTNKSALNAQIDEGASPHELYANRVYLEAVYNQEMHEDEAPLTYTFFKGITPEEFVAQCDADAPDRVYLCGYNNTRIRKMNTRMAIELSEPWM